MEEKRVIRREIKGWEYKTREGMGKRRRRRRDCEEEREME
jgi:hypothetical protein